MDTDTGNKSSIEVVDLDGVVRDWAWDCFRSAASCRQRGWPRECVLVDLDWSRVTVEHLGTTYVDEGRLETSPRALTLYKTTLRNRGANEQDCGVSASRTTAAVAEVELSQSVTRETSLNLSLKVPGSVPGSVLEASAGFKVNIELGQCRRQTVEEQLTWAVDLRVKVPAGKSSTVVIRIEEQSLVSAFSIDTVLAGTVKAVIRDGRQKGQAGEQGQSGTCWLSGNIATILRDRLPPPSIMPRTGQMSYDLAYTPNSVLLRTVGSVRFLFGARQHVDIHDHDSGSRDTSDTSQESQKSEHTPYCPEDGPDKDSQTVRVGMPS